MTNPKNKKPPSDPLPDSKAQQLQKRNRELAILNTIAEALNRQVDLDQALHSALAHVVELLDLQTGWVWLLHEKDQGSYLAVAQNLPPALAENPRSMEGTCYCLDTYHAGDMNGAANINVVACSRLKGLLDGTDGLRYHASIPLYAQDKKLGVLNVASSNWRRLSADDLRILYTVGDLLSIAIERARLFEQSTQLGVLEERNRLAREIHDTLAQGLTAVSLKLESADALLEAEGDLAQIKNFVQEALHLTRANLNEARRSVLDLRAAPLQDRNLVEALQNLGDDWTRTHAIPVDLTITGASHPLPIRLEVGLYRIVQETLTNIARHARASQVKIKLKITPAQIDLSIEDDGCGFDPAEVSQNSYGLVGINERTKLMGGQLRLESNAGAGARIEVTIPQ